MGSENLTYINRGPAKNGSGYIIDLIKDGWQRAITYTGYVNPRNDNCFILYPRLIGEGRVDKRYYEKHEVCIFDGNYKTAY